MNAKYRKNWKAKTLSATVLAASLATGYVGFSASTSSAHEGLGASADSEGPVATMTPTAEPTATEAVAASTNVEGNRPPSGPGGRGGRGEGGEGGENHHIAGMDTNPPEVVLAPSQAEVASTQASEKVAGADFYDGMYYGDAVEADRWGAMQVVAVIENGVLVDVLIAQYPDSTYESDIITRNALPTLIAEAISAQDADIDFVSRATDSSRAFVQSLESALLDAAIGIDL